MKSFQQISCILTHLEKDNVLCRKHTKCCRKVLFQRSKCSARDPKRPFNPAHTGSFLINVYNKSFLFFRRAFCALKYSIGTTGFTVILQATGRIDNLASQAQVCAASLLPELLQCRATAGGVDRNGAQRVTQDLGLLASKQQ